MTAQEIYEKRQKEINILLDIISKQVNKPMDNITWSNVGDLGYIKSKLEELL